MENSWMTKRFLILLLLIIMCGLFIKILRKHVVYSSEHSIAPTEQYGKTFNSERAKRNLPIIEDSWIIRMADSSHIQWSHESILNKRNTPEHIWKTLYVKDSVLLYEEDAFNYDQGDSISDRLIISSNFQKTDSLNFKFSRHYYRSYPPSQSIEVDFEFADSVLNKWGFKNLYIDSKSPSPVQ